MDDRSRPPIDIDGFVRQSKFLTLFRGALVPFVDGPLRFGNLNRDVSAMQQLGDCDSPVKAALDVIGLKPNFDGPGVDKLDPGKPEIIIANQPLGAAEAPAIGWLAERSGCEFRIFGTHYIGDIGTLTRFVISVDSFDRQGHKVENVAPLRTAVRALRNNATLLLFPSGTVSRFSFASMSITDGPWSHHAIQLARMTQARIIPAFVHGHNSRLFYTFDRIHPLLKSLVLVREFYRQNAIGSVRVTVGQPLEPEDIARLPADKVAATQRLRDIVYSLGSGG